MTTPFQEQFDLYKTQRTTDDIDLVQETRRILTEAGLGQEVAIAFDSNPYVLDALTKKPEVQRYMLNRFWNIQLLTANAESFEERYCLIPNGNVLDWLRLFAEKIVPFAVTHRLPKVI